jgi:YD repeat-containing protein
MTYDVANEVLSLSYSDSSAENVTINAYNPSGGGGYDADGQLLNMSDATGSSTWAFDSLHRMKSYQNGKGVSTSYGYTYGAGPSYDLRNQVRSIAYPNSAGTVSQTWDTDGRLSSVKDWNSKTTSFGYDANSNYTTETVPSTTTVTDTFGFNAADQLTSVSDSNGSTLFSATYTRDSNGQLASDSSQASNQAKDKYSALNQVCYAGSAPTNAAATYAGYYAQDNGNAVQAAGATAGSVIGGVAGGVAAGAACEYLSAGLATPWCGVAVAAGGAVGGWAGGQLGNAATGWIEGS